MARPAGGVAGVECDVHARASFQASAEELPALRRSPGRLGEALVPSSLLRHADDQAVVGVAAVLGAVSAAGLDPDGFGAWGVVAAPQYLGRGTFFGAAFPQFLAEGAWGVSPHLIPSLSLHSLSGTISQLLKAQGPNLGASGGPGGESEAFLLAATLLAEAGVPGVWVVLTGWDGDRGAEGQAKCRALAIALAAPQVDWPGDRLRITPEGLAPPWRVDGFGLAGPKVGARGPQ
jgi:hypothetical protein